MWVKGLTRRLEGHASCAEVGAGLRVHRRKSEVCKDDTLVVHGQKDILRLDVAMRDALLVAVYQGIEYLQERPADAVRIRPKNASRDSAEERAALAVLEYDAHHAVSSLDERAKELEDAGMPVLSGDGVRGYFEEGAQLRITRRAVRVFDGEDDLECVLLLVFEVQHSIYRAKRAAGEVPEHEKSSPVEFATKQTRESAGSGWAIHGDGR